MSAGCRKAHGYKVTQSLPRNRCVGGSCHRAFIVSVACGLAQQLPHLFDVALVCGLIADGDPDGVLIVQLGVGHERFAAGVDGVDDGRVVRLGVGFSSRLMTKTHR